MHRLNRTTGAATAAVAIGMVLVMLLSVLCTLAVPAAIVYFLVTH